MNVIPKILGADIELGNSLTGHGNWEAARRVLAQSLAIPAFRGAAPRGAGYANSTESGRHFLANGGCLYIDLSHLEMCVGETLSARAHAAAFHAMLRIVRSCVRRARKALSEGEDLFVNAHVSDGSRETSWGAHLNVSISRELWDNIFHHKPHVQALLASYLAAAIPVFGQGLVLPVGQSACRFVCSARAHHLGELSGLATTMPFQRNLLNRRDEAHGNEQQARLHLIAFDTNLQPTALFLRTGLTQLILAALESGRWFDADLLLDSPLAAVRQWSASFSVDIGSMTPVNVARPNGDPITLTAWHRRLVRGLRPLLIEGVIPEEAVPHGREILDLWEDTLEALENHQLDRLAARLDWALKWQFLEAELPGCGGDLADPVPRLLDQLYSHVDDQVGLFWSFWRAGLVERCGVDDEAIGRFILAGDPGTRSGLRGELVRRLRPWITDIDWEYLEFSDDPDAWWWSAPRRRFDMPDPAAPSAEGITLLRERYRTDRELLRGLMEAASRPEPLSPPRLPAKNEWSRRRAKKRNGKSMPP